MEPAIIPMPKHRPSLDKASACFSGSDRSATTIWHAADRRGMENIKAGETETIFRTINNKKKRRIKLYLIREFRSYSRGCTGVKPLTTPNISGLLDVVCNLQYYFMSPIFLWAQSPNPDKYGLFKYWSIGTQQRNVSNVSPYLTTEYGSDSSMKSYCLLSADIKPQLIFSYMQYYIRHYNK